jgi:uncharacterized FAD-dependent dehydrogenase
MKAFVATTAASVLVLALSGCSLMNQKPSSPQIAPGTASDDTLLYGVEVKFYNMEVALDENLETPHKGLFVIGDGSGVTHSLSHASASGVYVARYLAEHE